MAVGYVHFLDLYHYMRARRSHRETEIFREAQRALRLAILRFDRTFVPASSFFESDLAKDILNLHPLLCQTGRINLIAAEPSLDEHREAKIIQYGSLSPLGLDIAYGSRARTSTRYVRRNNSARLAIEYQWLATLERNRLLTGIDPNETLGLPLTLESAWSRVPGELGSQAFITDHAFESASRLIGHRPLALRQFMERVIERAYMDSYVLELAAGIVEDLVCLASPFDLPASPHSISYEVLLRNTYQIDLLPLLDGPETDFIAADLPIRQALSAVGPTSLTFGRSVALSPIIGQPATPGIAILTALEYEWLAIFSLLTDTRQVTVTGDPNRYTLGFLPALDGSSRAVEVLLTQCLRMNTKSACSSATRLCLQFDSVTDIVMSGIAGAVPRPQDPARDVRLGDVVVVERAGVIDVDHVMRHPKGVESRSNLPPPSARLGAVLSANLSSSAFQLAIEEKLTHLASVNDRFKRPPSDTDILRDDSGHVLLASDRSEPRIFRGLIGSGDSLVRDPHYRDELGRRFGVLALEMESAGLAEGAHQCARQYFVVRSLVDYCDTFKNDTWHWYAAAAAAAVATTILSAV